MIDLRKTIEAKSDQLNADDLLGGPRILKITKVKEGSAEQPIAISYEGDNGKPWKPSKGMRRVLVAAWGPDGEGYIGRQVEVYTDPTVKWAGSEVGGIRIFRLSDIKNTIVMPLAVAKGKKVPVTIKPLIINEPKELPIEERKRKALGAVENKGIEITPEIEQAIAACENMEQLKAAYEKITTPNQEGK